MQKHMQVYYSFLFGATRLDINECAEGLDDCSELQICANTDGGFTCPCVSGYQLVSDNKTCEGT